MKAKKIIAAGLAGLMTASTLLSGCGGSSSDESATEYTWLLAGGVQTFYYMEYEENPIYKYWSAMDWDVDGETKNISIDFMTPTAGAEKDNINTLLATGDYPDVMDMSYSPENAMSLYEQGIALDLTEYIEKYMPNYLERVNEDPKTAAQVVNVVDGEKKYLQIFALSDTSEEPYCGYEYRRDWIVKYGTNPETGEAFSGHWTDDTKSEWVDDVVFPSGGSDPVYISDWEWMLDIFATALEEENIDDGYAMQLYYTGYMGTGDFASGFGATGSNYLDDDAVAQFGGTSEEFRASIECTAAWYEKGWIDTAFEENSNDAIPWRVDEATVHAGKVGMWFGLNSSLGAQMENTDGNEDDPLYGIVVYGAAQPINDVYGDESCQGVTPFAGFGSSTIGTSVILTNKMEEKDIAALLTALDYLYSDEGSRLAYRGFSEEEQSEINDDFYNEHGVKGAYTLKTAEDGSEKLVVSNDIYAEDGLDQAVRLLRIPTYQINSGADLQHPDYYTRAVEEWSKYPFTGTISSVVEGQMTADQSAETSLNTTNIRTLMSQEIPNFVTGRKDINDDAAWDEYVKSVEELDPYTYCDYINVILGNE